MKAIVCVRPLPEKALSLLSLFFLPAVSREDTNIGTEPVRVYTLNPVWRCRFQSLVSALCKEHPELLFDEGMKAYPKLYREPLWEEIYFNHLKNLLSCHCGGRFIRPVVISLQKDERLPFILEVLSHYAKAVTLCTRDSVWFESVSLEAMKTLGLSLNRREPDTLETADFWLLLSGESVQVPPSCPGIDFRTEKDNLVGNSLADFSGEPAENFFLRFPHLRLKHCCLISPSEKIQKIIWKIQKKS